MSKIRTFLDSGVLMAAIRGDSKLHLAAFAVVDDPNREFVTTDFIKLELLPKAIFNKQVEEASFYNDFFNQASEIIEITPEITRGALELACELGLGACDAVHLHTALVSSTTEFITTEKPEKPFFRVTNTSLNLTSLHSE